MRLCLLLLLMPAAAHAAESAEPLLSGGFRLFIGLLLVLGLMLLMYALSKRGLRWLPGHREGRIQIRETRPLGAKKALCLVEVKGRELLIGVSHERIELLCEFAPSAQQSFEQTLQQQGLERPI